MRALFKSKGDLRFDQVVDVQKRICRHFGESDFIPGELQFATVPIRGLFRFDLNGLALKSLFVKCYLPKGEKAFPQLRNTYEQLEPFVGAHHAFRSDYDFRTEPDPSGKPDNLSVLVVKGKKSFGFRTQSITHRNVIVRQVIERAHLSARIVEENDRMFVQPVDPNSGITVSDGLYDGSNPSAVRWPATGTPAEIISAAERLACALAKDPVKGISCSWEADTIESDASELLAFLNAQNLTLPRGKLEFAYCLQEMDGLEHVRALLGPKAKLSAEAAVFRYPEEDRGVLWVETTPNGYKVELHLDDPDRIKELQRYLGVKFQWKKNPD
jgi:hypothetical protein